jgi:hypothetical protein
MLILLINNTFLISNINEVVSELGQPDCSLVKPYVVKEDMELEPWLTDYTRNDEIMISSDKILTLVEPKKTLLDKYLELTK